MSRILKLLASRSFMMLLFHLGLLFFLWPILSIPAGDGGPVIFRYVFTAWAALVFMLVLVGTAIRIIERKGTDSNDD